MLGFFDDKNREYVIKNMFPRRPLINYLWNEKTVCTCNQFGEGFCWGLPDTNRRMIDKGIRNVYIKDRKSGEFFVANRNYKKEDFEIFEAHVGLGYHTIIAQHNGIRIEYTLLVPTEGMLLLSKISVKNVTDSDREIDVYYCNEPQPDLSGHEPYGWARYEKDIQAILYGHTGFALPTKYQYLYVSSSQDIFGYDVCKSRFLGMYNGAEDPIFLREDKLVSCTTAFEKEYISALQYRLNLKKGEEWEVVLACGMSSSEEDARALAVKYADLSVFEAELALQAKENAKALDVFTVKTPDDCLNSQTNIWLKRQLSLGKTWGRVYGKGYRDIMQDITAFVSFDTALARKRLLYALRYQYEDGNAIRMFEPDFLYPYNDCGSWVPAAVLSYLNESGDVSILDEEVTFLEGNFLEKSSYEEKNSYRPYTGTAYTKNVFTHVKMIIDYLCNCLGQHGLVLFLGGDWNDSLNNVGKKGIGESVWLSIATVKAINEFCEIAKIYGKEELCQEYQAQKDELARNILKYGVDGDHLLYGFNDYGEKIGTDDDEYAKIYLNPQTWAVLANLTDKKTLEVFMDSVEKRLICDFGYMQCYPSYRKGTDKIGRVSYFQPGQVENGAVYNHGVAFKIVADCMLGRGDLAYETLKRIRFDNPKNPDNGMEPYAISNMYIGPESESFVGYAPMSWITGTAGWIYRAITEYMCGIQATMQGLKIQPCLPSEWKEITVTRWFRGAKYEITIKKADQTKMIVDGFEMLGNIIPIFEENKTCKVVFEVGNAL